MVSLRFDIYVYAIIFMLLHFIVFSLQDSQNMVVMTRDKIVEERPLISQQVKGVLEAPAKSHDDTLNIDHFRVEAVVKGKMIGGRKLTTSKIVSSSSSANPRNVDYKVPKRTKKIYQNDHDHDVEVKMSSTFMALNADYHVPRSHPPRNN